MKLVLNAITFIVWVVVISVVLVVAAFGLRDYLISIGWSGDTAAVTACVTTLAVLTFAMWLDHKMSGE